MVKSAYCPITHLAMTAWPTRSWHELLMGMFTACFDASGQEHQHSYIVVAGFISSAEEWINFSHKWDEILHNNYSLKAFHAADCQNYEGEFKSWKGDDTKRIRLWCDLLELIKGTVFQKFACGIEVPAWDKTISKNARMKWKLNAYAMCALTCAERVREWARKESIISPIEYVYESGDPGGGVIIEHLRREGFPDPSFRHKYDSFKNGIFVPKFTPLQAADFLAYETFLTKKILAKKGKPALGRPIYTFNDMQERARICNAKRLQGMETTFRKSVKVRDLWRFF